MRHAGLDQVDLDSRVLTLIRPEGRMRREAVYLDGSNGWFQPSSDPKAGCDSSLGLNILSAMVFQPSSDPKAGCDTRLSSGCERC